MYKNVNWIKRGAVAAVAAGLMLGALPGVALAETDASAVANQQIIEKVYKGDAQNDSTAFTFKFTYEKGMSTQNGTNQLDPNLADQYSWDTVGLCPDGGWSKDKTDSITFGEAFEDISFATPGQYVFKVEENDASDPNVADNDQIYYVVVNVTWQEGYPAQAPEVNHTVIKDVKAYDTKSTDEGESIKDRKVSTAIFTNESNAVSEDDNLTVTKKVAGVLANTDDYFQYTLTLKGVTGKYTVKCGNDTKTIEVPANKTEVEYVFYLKHGESIEVEGLPKTATYSVVESDKVVSTDNEGNHSIAEGAADNGYNESVNMHAEDGNGATATGTIPMATDNAVVYTNTKGAASNTGITMNTLPFVGVAAVAAAGAVTLVISRKRRAGEEF